MYRFIDPTGFVLTGLLMAQSAAALPLIILDENGNGTVDVGSGPVLQSGTLQADPGPGGLASALTYTLLGSPPGLVAGDVFLQEPGGILDLIRFNPIGTGGSVANAIVFYSAVGGLDLADTGLPGFNYAKPLTISEVGGVANYTHRNRPRLLCRSGGSAYVHEHPADWLCSREQSRLRRCAAGFQLFPGDDRGQPATPPERRGLGSIQYADQPISVLQYPGKDAPSR